MNTNQVDERFGCPNCGERDADLLVLDDEEETVYCDACGACYPIV